ncbi:phosphoribosylanthranilate isomerase [Runella sp. MFBS21]|uniref:phosphoribosylanthranilate isomerase n=1 Tax=Runella sp. MFBS21 TaxID=3034018 RepID=UPI0023F8D474|nr:phosphoribosylanthranilate isomerase [Runella sp. MFBS21]MDF7820761.1 phosphoribosylanthranilate isomerase [Runella sp. MFBS21]
MKIKVCGMRDTANLAELLELKPDFIGFIFYDKSPRFVGEALDEEFVKNIPKPIKKVGVFVNANPDFILRNVKKYDLQFVQLHGHETPDFCRTLKMRGANIIKAFSVDENFNFATLNNYKPHCDFFLFDAKGTQPGGNGITFNWDVLKRYDNDKPFFLSGGLSLENIEDVSKLENAIFGLDVNSKFETEPAIKDIEKLKQLMEMVRPAAEEVEA